MKRNHTFDVIKGICILFVIITHYAWTDEERLRYLFPFWIDMAVPVFMLLSGYLYTWSYEQNGVNNLSKAYDLGGIMKRVIRFTVPFALAYCSELIINHFAPNRFFSAVILSDSKFFLFFQGGIGPGSYYYPVMIQFVFVFPLIYCLVKKYNSYGLFLCLCINVGYELMQRAYHFGESGYRLLIFRYILLIAFGCFLCENQNRKIRVIWVALAFSTGIVFLIANQYLGFQPIILTQWTRTSWLPCLYIKPIAAFLIKHVQLKCLPLEVFGKASYDIFLVQMIYYTFLCSYVYNKYANAWVRISINLVLCLSVGLVFYYIETPLTRRLINIEMKIITKIKNVVKTADRLFLQ